MPIGNFVFVPTLANLTCRKAAKAKKTDELVHGEKNSTLRWQVLNQEFFSVCLKWKFKKNNNNSLCFG